MTLGMKEMVVSRLTICALFAAILMTDYIMQKLFFNQFCRNICFFKWLLAQCSSHGNRTVSIWIVIVESLVVGLYICLDMVRNRNDQLEKLHRASREVLTDVFQKYAASAQMLPQVPRPLSPGHRALAQATHVACWEGRGTVRCSPHPLTPISPAK